MKSDERTPQETVDAILQARKTAAAAEQIADENRREANRLKAALERCDSMHAATIRRYNQQLDKLASDAEAAQVASVITLVLSISVLIVTILRIVA